MGDELTSAGLLDLPTSPAARAAIELVTCTESVVLRNHSIRSYLFARLLAAHCDIDSEHDFDPEVLFMACVLHDIGLSTIGDRGQRFEVDGADVAAEFLTEEGFAPHRVETVWEAIALHTSPGIAERHGVICELTRRGIGVDFGRESDLVAGCDGATIHRAYPRLDMERSLVDEIVAQGQGRPNKAPPYTIAGELVRERTTPPYTTLLEQQTAKSRWSADGHA